MTTTQDEATDDTGVFTEESREVLRVRPSEVQEDDPDLEDRIDQIASLYDLRHEPEQGIVPNLLGSNTGDPVRFEMLVLSAGADEPVEIYYSSEDHLETLEHRLNVIYPRSFDIERQRLDLGANLIKPVRYPPDEFLDELKAGNLAYDLDDLAVDVRGGADAAFGGELESGLDAEVEDGLVPVEDVEKTGSPATQPDPDSEPTTSSETAESSESLSPTEVFDQARDQSESSAGSSSDEFETESWARRDDVPSDHRFLRLPDREGEAVKINPASRLDEVDSPIHLERPTFTEDRDVLARPSRDNVDPCAVRWRGKGSRKNDWMTTLRSDETAQTESDDGHDPKESVMSDLLVQLCEIEPPIAFQITFQARPSWSVKATSRKDDLRKGEDTRMEKVVSTITGPTDVDERSLPSDIRKRLDQIEQKNPKKTFDVNLRAVAVDSEATLQDEETQNNRREEINSRLRNLCPEFDPLDGQFYEVDGVVVEEGSKISTGTASTPQDELEYLLDRGLTTSADAESRTEKLLGDSVIRSELVLNPLELSDFITVPPGDALSREAFRGVRAKRQEENPLPPPNPDIRKALSDGMAVGRPLKMNREPFDEPIELHRNILKRHYARFALTGFGKSIAVQNDLQTLHANTPGPEILIDPKGDGMCERYLKAHYAQFGDLDDVYYFNVPDDIPAVSFFDLRPLLTQGRAREDAIEQKVSRFHQIMLMLMGPDYTNAYVAIIVLTFLIKAMFDPEHGHDAFTIDELYEKALQMQREQRIPKISSDRVEVEQSLARQFENDEASFNETMTALLNRLDKIRENKHLYRMFNHVPEWDFQRQTYADSTPSFSFEKFFEKDSVVLFNIGDLKPEPARAMSLVLVSNLWDEIHKRDSDGEHTLVNLILEEAAPLSSAPLMYKKVIPEGRSFGLSLGLIMQYPGQVKNQEMTNERAYEEIKNNVQSTLYGRIQDNSDLADELATYSLDPVQMKTKLSLLRGGEWVVDLPSEFDELVPSPFSVKALPIPPGHPKSDRPLSDADKRKFDRVHLSKCRKRIQEHYSIQGGGQREETLYTEPQSPEEVEEIPHAVQKTASTGSESPASEPPSPSPSQQAQTPPSPDEPTAETGDSTESTANPGRDKTLRDVMAKSDIATGHSTADSETGAVSGDVTDRTGEQAETTPDQPPTDDPERATPDDYDAGAGTEGATDDGSSEPFGEFLGSEPSDDAAGNGAAEPVDETDDEPERHTTGASSPGDQEHTQHQPSQEQSPDQDSHREATPTHSDTTPDTTPNVEDSGDDPNEGPGHAPADDYTGPIADDDSSREAGVESSQPEEQPTGMDDVSESTEQTYGSVKEVYREAIEINTQFSGGERFKKLAELSSDVENAGISLDDDQLATVTDEADIPADDAARDHSEQAPAPSEDTDSNTETGTEGGGENSGPSRPEPSERMREAMRDNPRGVSPIGDDESLLVDDQLPSADEIQDRSRKDPEDFRKTIQETAEKVGQDNAGFSEPEAPGSEDVRLSDDNEKLLHLILNAMNGELDEFSFTDLESMKDLVEQVEDPDIDRLRELDFLQKDRVINRNFYTVLPAGREYLGRTLKSGDGVGDLGEKSPHKVGVAVLHEFFDKEREDVSRVGRYQTIDGVKFDVVGYGESGEIVVVGEAETPSNNPDAIVTDYEKMAELDADAFWLCQNKSTARDVISVLEDREIITDKFKSANQKSIKRITETVADRDLPGMTQMRSFTRTANEIDTGEGDGS